MHVYTQAMRTTVEISNELRELLLREAARRGEKGYSTIIERALRLYFRSADSEETLRATAHRLRGSMKRDDIEVKRERVAAVRSGWRAGGEP